MSKTTGVSFCGPTSFGGIWYMGSLWKGYHWRCCSVVLIPQGNCLVGQRHLCDAILAVGTIPWDIPLGAIRWGMRCHSRRISGQQFQNKTSWTYKSKVSACQSPSRHPKCKTKIGWAPRLVQEGRTDSIALDITHDPVTMDLTTPTGFLTACYHATCLRVGAGLLAAPVCSSFVYMQLDSWKMFDGFFGKNKHQHMLEVSHRFWGCYVSFSIQFCGFGSAESLFAKPPKKNNCSLEPWNSWISRGLQSWV